MKKICMVLLTVLLLFSLCACAEVEETYTVEKGWRTFQVDTKACTVSDGTDTYTYTFSGNSDSYGIKVIYPDGSYYSQTKSGSHITGSTSKDYDSNRYVSGDILCDVIAEGAPAAPRDGNPQPSIVFVGLGLFLLLAPQVAWFLEWGWRFKNAEPSNAALIVNRVVGGVCILVGVLDFVSFLV